MNEVLKTGDYEQSKTGEQQLLFHIFMRVQKLLGEEYERNTIRAVLNIPELFNTYLEKYRLEKDQILEIEKNTPCKKTEAEAMNSLKHKVERRDTVRGFANNLANILSEKDIFELDETKLNILKFFYKELLEAIGGEWLINKGMTVEKLEILKEFSANKLSAIGGEWLVHKNMIEYTLLESQKYEESFLSEIKREMKTVSNFVAAINILKEFSKEQEKVLEAITVLGFSATKKQIEKWMENGFENSAIEF